MPELIQVNYIAGQIRGKHCTPVISNQLILDILFGKRHMFCVGLDCVEELDGGQTSPNLRQQFEAAGKQLSAEAQVQVLQPGNNWAIIDGQCEYLIRRDNQTLDVERKTVTQAWADEVEYPLADSNNATRVAQFFNVQAGNVAKWSYLQFLKKRLLGFERQKEGASQAFLDNVEKQVDNLTFTQLAVEQLHHPDFTKQQNGNALDILARLELPVYITTSHHCFLEEALKATGKTPRTEAYAWREDLDIPAECAVDLRLQPSVDEPVVFHLFGIDSYDASLVLTEDDHLDFLVSIMHDFNDVQKMPSHLRDAISKSMLLLLGYDIHGWDLKTFLKGLIENTQKHPDSVAIQIDPADGSQIRDIQRFSEYVQRYFKRVKFDVIWDAPEDFVAALGNVLK